MHRRGPRVKKLARKVKLGLIFCDPFSADAKGWTLARHWQDTGKSLRDKLQIAGERLPVEVSR
jgi:hypothetical protein